MEIFGAAFLDKVANLDLPCSQKNYSGFGFDNPRAPRPNSSAAHHLEAIG